MNHDLLYNDLTEIVFDFNETDIDIAIISYNSILHFYSINMPLRNVNHLLFVKRENGWRTVHTVKRQKN